eukprot:TRINITY_DN33597_c0_g1_i1.p1 TRINITY_DN33597_c0_g1~~TRINITY_DN33597_c0_g1_i1.p1  ORF type:complete len:113 (-),score=2.53 TRINITY_DN33597_c0_g1_i1:99-437(-)
MCMEEGVERSKDLHRTVMFFCWYVRHSWQLSGNLELLCRKLSCVRGSGREALPKLSLHHVTFGWCFDFWMMFEKLTPDQPVRCLVVSVPTVDGEAWSAHCIHVVVRRGAPTQ